MSKEPLYCKDCIFNTMLEEHKIMGDKEFTGVCKFQPKYFTREVSKCNYPIEVCPKCGGKIHVSKHKIHLEGNKMPINTYGFSCNCGYTISGCKSRRILFDGWKHYFLLHSPNKRRRRRVING